ncbi:hypothetical protein ACP70R_029272 [Stipagrostis hirtigluma subsp. patula]
MPARRAPAAAFLSPGRRPDSAARSGMDSIHNELSSLERVLEGREKPCNLSLSTLKHITNDFSEEQKIGEGGCGGVYKGVLQNGNVVAVKKLHDRCMLDDKQFNQEVQSMMMVDHTNIVRFIGYCSHTEQKATSYKGKFVMADMPERLLCFEYSSNGSLDAYLTDELRGLEWYARYKIIKGICEGLHHLHKEKHIIHMDLKPANILLDDHMVPKIADFGLSRLDDITRTLSNDRLLSPQYCAPEYQHLGKMSPKSDIYSLGIIILELVTGSKERPDITLALRRWKHRWNKTSKHTLSDYKQVTKCIELALSCMNEDPPERPFIWDIIDTLNQIENANSDGSTVDQTLSSLEDMLGIEPLELHFPFEPNKQISCSLQLSNDTNDYFAFRIETMNPLQYCIEPIQDVVPPRSKYIVNVMTQTREQAPKHKHCKEDLSVRSTKVDESLKILGITKDVFSGKTEKVVDMVNLIIVFDTPLLPAEPEKDLSDMPQILMDEVSPKHQRAGKSSDELQLSAPKVVFRRSLLFSLRHLVQRRRNKKMLEKPKHDKEAPSASPRPLSPTPQQHPLSPMGGACCRMDLPAMHQILEETGYRDDEELGIELSLQQWTERGQLWTHAKQRGDIHFRDKRFMSAIECYTEANDVLPTMSPTIYVRRSLCHLMCDQPDSALRDAMEAERQHPEWPTALYLQAVALSKSNMQLGAMNAFNEALKHGERRTRDKEMRHKEEEESRLREEKWQAINKVASE